MCSCKIVNECFSLFVVFTDTANTEIYTYLHSLSLHDALPISADPSTPSRNSSPRSRTSSTAGTTDATRSPGPRPPTRSCPTPPVNETQTRDTRFPNPHRRSEEHKSELQSLMRTSYAYFCLKNKT